ncbi:MAG: hypothetical protein K6356_11120 [Chloroflexus sp.]
MLDHNTIYVYQSSALVADIAHAVSPVRLALSPADRRDRFIATLQQTGLIGAACTAASVDPFTPYQERSENPTFAQAGHEARQRGHDRQRGAA